jgi:hypothetical protein
MGERAMIVPSGFLAFACVLVVLLIGASLAILTGK